MDFLYNNYYICRVNTNKMKIKKPINKINDLIYIYRDKVGFNCRVDMLKSNLERYADITISYADGSVKFTKEAIDYISEMAEEVIATCYVSNSTMKRASQMSSPAATNEANKYDNIFHRTRGLVTPLSAEEHLTLLFENLEFMELRDMAELPNNDDFKRTALGNALFHIIQLAGKEMILIEDELEKVLREEV